MTPSDHLARELYRHAYAGSKGKVTPESSIFAAAHQLRMRMEIGGGMATDGTPYVSGLTESAMRLRRIGLHPSSLNLLSTSDLIDMGTAYGEELMFAFLIAMRAAAAPDSPWLDILTKFYNESEGM